MLGNDANLAAIKAALAEHQLDFDMETWLSHTPDWIQGLRKDLQPGTYSHYLLLLLETPENINHIQGDMQRFLENQYPDKFGRVHKISESGVHGSSEIELLASEFQTLRNLLE